MHSCCSVAKLKRALADPNITAIEADVLMSSPGPRVPIMAHPPSRSSDLDFSQFIDRVIADGSRHMKLDFKEAETLEPCLALLAARAPQLIKNGQVVWLNADVLPGPNARHSPVPVPAHMFLPLCRRICPFALLSLGWRLSPIGAEEAYTERDAALMERLCLDHGVSGDKVVFAAAVRFAELAPQPLISLLHRVPHSELLLWTGTGEMPVRTSTTSHLTTAMVAAGLSDRVGYDVRLARNYTQHAQAHAVDCTFFCSRWSRWLCCGSRVAQLQQTGERQGLLDVAGVSTCDGRRDPSCAIS
jgi:hypothetical protein